MTPRSTRCCAKANSVGVFQVESRAQMSMLPRLKPRKYYDLVVEVAIVRPGPIQGGMVHPYLQEPGACRRRDPLSQRGKLKAILKRTRGVPLFQEQAMQIAIDCAGFLPAKADKLRRAMATFRRAGTIHKLKDDFINGMLGNKYEQGVRRALLQADRGLRRTPPRILQLHAVDEVVLQLVDSGGRSPWHAAACRPWPARSLHSRSRSGSPVPETTARRACASGWLSACRFDIFG